MLARFIPASDELRQYLEYVGRLGYTDEPDYARCRQFFTSAMRKHGFSDAGALQLTGEGATPKVRTLHAVWWCL